MRQKVFSKALCPLKRSKQGWQPSFEEDTPPAASSVPWHEAETRLEGGFYQCYLKRSSHLTIPAREQGLEETLGVQVFLWSNGRWRKRDRASCKGTLNMDRLCKGWSRTTSYAFTWLNSLDWLQRKEIPTRRTAQALPSPLQTCCRVYPGAGIHLHGITGKISC